jgi:hypothetical protein
MRSEYEGKSSNLHERRAVSSAGPEKMLEILEGQWRGSVPAADWWTPHICIVYSLHHIFSSPCPIY